MQLLVAHVVKRGTRKPNILCLSLGLTTESGVIALIQFVCALEMGTPVNVADFTPPSFGPGSTTKWKRIYVRVSPVRLRRLARPLPRLDLCSPISLSALCVQR